MRTAPYKHPWTFKIFLEYLACDRCGYIIESREDYQVCNGKHLKELICPRCHHQFQVEKKGIKYGIS